MARLSTDDYAKIRAQVEDGKIQVGSPQHLSVIQHDLDILKLSKRDKKIVVLSIRGWTQVAIADAVGVSRSTVGYVIREFFGR